VKEGLGMDDGTRERVTIIYRVRMDAAHRADLCGAAHEGVPCDCGADLTRVQVHVCACGLDAGECSQHVRHMRLDRGNVLTDQEGEV
jgi:hypothetical protein